MREFFLQGSSVLGMSRGLPAKVVAVVRSKPESFLYESQKRFGTPAGFDHVVLNTGAARNGL